MFRFSTSFCADFRRKQSGQEGFVPGSAAGHVAQHLRVHWIEQLQGHRVFWPRRYSEHRLFFGGKEGVRAGSIGA